MTRKVVGKKTGRKGVLSKSYSLYDTCEICPVRVYTDLVCNDNLKALVKDGSPSIDVLEDAKVKLIVEFAELSGNNQVRSANDTVKDMYLVKSQLEGIKISASLIAGGDFERAIEYLAKLGLHLHTPKCNEDVDKLIKRLQGFTKSKVIAFEKLQNKYVAMATSGGEKMTEQHYNEQLATLSKYAGFRLDKSITLAEFAAYLKEYSQFIDKQQNGKFRTNS